MFVQMPYAFVPPPDINEPGLSAVIAEAPALNGTSGDFSEDKLLPNGLLKRRLSYCNYVWLDLWRMSRTASLVKPRFNTTSTADCPIEWITYTSTCNVGTRRLTQQLATHDIPLTVFGIGHRWRRQWGLRMRVLHDYLATIPAERLIIWSDADDVMLMPGVDIDHIIAAFNTLVRQRAGPLVFLAAEKACFPRGDWSRNYTDPADVAPGGKGPSPFKYLNAGLMIGQAGHIAEMLRLAYMGDCIDDQLQLTTAFLRPILWWQDLRTGRFRYALSTPPHSPGWEERNRARGIPAHARPLVGLDHWNDLLAALYDVRMRDLVVQADRGRIVVRATGGAPAIVHQNGDKLENSVLEQLAVVLGLPFDFSGVHNRQLELES
ncbi:hypothetical protein HK105_204033 [Polyrhizophydium stewartii]|uniref:PLOD1-3-like GT domain-containing protein n=1 Tax=Polyrhizophydium stewartii TaxID=2732419 RepID=A0ABR4N9V1_9FUNG